MYTQFLSQVIKTATELHVANINHNKPYDLMGIYKDPLPDLSADDFPLGKVISENHLNYEEQVILLLALAPYFAPQLLDIFLAKNPNFDAICSEFGGITQAPHRGVIPTGQTAVFLLAGRDLKRRREIAQLFLPSHKFHKAHLIRLGPVEEGLPILSGKLIPDEELVQRFLYGKVILPKLSRQFPAELLATHMNWEDLIVPASTREQLTDLENWLNHYQALSQHPTLGKRSRKGYRTLFHGPPGTGKTLTASLLGKSTNRPVFRIDLSMMVSKYIGETEKNLSNIFSKAENKDWILFFDEADALFGKRSKGDSANDRFANQEVSYLLQRIENYNGMVILATNLKSNLDSAFTRRFQSMVHFPRPEYPERLLIWQNNIPKDFPLAREIEIEKLSKNYELTAAQTSNILQGCFIGALSAKKSEISKDNLLKNIRLELGKENLLFEDRL